MDCAIAQGIKRDVALRNKAKRRASKVVKKWSGLVENFWKRREQDLVQEISDVAAAHTSRATPRSREVLQIECYQTFLHYVFHDVRDCAALETMGVIRHEGDTVEFWCADEPMEDPTMKALLNEARLCRETHEKSQLRLARANEEPLMIKFKDTLTLENIRRIVQRRFRIKPVNQHLSMNGRVLSRGRLSEQGVRAGCVVVVAER